MRVQHANGRMGADVVASARRSAACAQLAWIDPGGTTGLFVVSVRPAWLAGEGLTTWEALGKAAVLTWHGQIGREPKIVSADGLHANVRPSNDAAVEVEQHKGLGALLAGRGRHGGGPVSELLSGETRQLVQIQAFLDLWPDAAWGTEDFTVAGSAGGLSREALSPIRLNAVLAFIEIVYGERGRIPFVQGRSLAKTTATDERLKSAGFYRPGMGHATDAARHAATFLRRCRAEPELRAAAWPRLFGQRTKTKHEQARALRAAV